jgi:hypothetical protein
VTLPARKRSKLRPRGGIEPNTRQRRLDTGLERPVGLGDLVGLRVAALRALEQGKRVRHAEEIGNRLALADLHRLVQQAEPSLDDDAARLRPQLAGNQPEQRRLADAVAADKAGPLAPELQIEVFEDFPAVGQSPRQAGERDGSRHDFSDGKATGICCRLKITSICFS